MKRLTALVSGSVQRVGYRNRLLQIATALGLKGFVENLKDGRVKILAEGEEDRLRWFEDAINISNTSIQVTAIEKSYSRASGEFSKFFKLVGPEDTDFKIDQCIVTLKELLFDLKEMNANLGAK